MTRQKDIDQILDLLICPGFCVQDNRIIKTNPAADALLLVPGTDVRSLLLTGSEEYEAFRDGSLYLKLNLTRDGLGCCVIRQDGTDYFLLDQPVQDEALQALALAARELRSAMSGAFVSADQLAHKADPENSQMLEQLARMNQSLHRTLRIIGNMSDAAHWNQSSRQEVREIGALFNEFFEKAAAFSQSAGITVNFTPMNEAVYTPVDREQLERATLNILSNAMKFAPAGTTVDASLTRSGKLVRLTVRDYGPGIADQVRNTLFSRYLRHGGIEDSRFGLGLGLVLVQSTATAHGGTVLVDHPAGGGTRVTMTLAIRQAQESQMRSPILVPDYAGCRDHTLVELADCLPHELYKP
jgi:signal transduction histidine kinase